jgi:hypothetical protein
MREPPPVGGARVGVVRVGTRAAAVGIGRGGGSGSVEEGREGRRVGERQGRREEAEGRGRQWTRVRVSAGEGKSNDYISSARDLSHRSEMDGQNLCGLFGP